MAKRDLCAMLIVTVFMLSSCTSIGLRKDIFSDEPIWEDPQLLSLVDTPTKHIIQPDGQGLLIQDQTAKALVEHPVGLGSLVKQVLGEQDAFAFYKEANLLTQSNDTLLAKETNPLPPDIASNRVVKAMVLTILDESKKLIRTEKKLYKDAMSEAADRLPDLRLSDDDFFEFGKLLAKEFWLPRHRALAQEKKDGKKEGFLKEKVGAKLTWADIFTMYLLEYYNGKYVDRYGIKYGKPKLDFRITNDAIVAFANIFQESLWDYSLLSLVKDVTDPVVYRTGQINNFINGTGEVPSFAKILRASFNPPQDSVSGLVEQERAGDNPGLSTRDVCVIHYFSGLSGDSSEALSGMLIRSLGGSNLGFVVAYGKFSIGDNETLTKLIDATTKTFSKRSADLLFSTILHRKPADKAQWADSEDKKNGWEWLEKHLSIAQFLKCFET